MAREHNHNPIRARRLELGISQEAAARRASVSLSSWANWEAMRVTPNVSKYADIAEALGISLDEVMDAVRVIERHILTRGAA